MEQKFNQSMRLGRLPIKKGLLVSVIAVTGAASIASADRGNNHIAFYVDLLSSNSSVVSETHISSDLEYSIGQLISLSDLQAMDGIAQSFEIRVVLGDQGSRFDGFESAFGDGLGNQGRAQNIHGANAEPKTDNFHVVPLPPAAFAGLGMLAGIAGVRYLRNRK